MAAASLMIWPKKDGRDFAHLCAKLIPANVVVDLQARLPGGLDASDLAIFQAIKEAIPNANELEPAQVLQFTLDAIRAHSAPLIDNRQTTGGTTE